MGERKNANLLRSNELYKETEIPAFNLVHRSRTWWQACFWYTIFIVFIIICTICIIKLTLKFQSNPTTTSLSNILTTTVSIPNITICLGGWPQLDEIILWSPGEHANYDSPSWVHTLPT